VSYNADKVSRSRGVCQGPGLAPLVVEAVKLGCQVVSWYCPFPWVHLLTVKSDKAVLEVSDGPAVHGPGGPLGPAVHGVSEDARVEAFREYRSKLADKVVIVQNRGDRSVVKVIRQADSSRYFPGGRRCIRAKISRRMGKWESCHGLMLTLTFDPKLISKADAWREVGSRGSDTMDALNLWRKRQGMPRVRGIRVLEVQKQTGYPHLHYVFPRLRWLCPVDKVTDWWSQAVNSVDISYKDSFSPVGYVCKYVSKLEGWSDEALSEIWLNRTRLYSMSRDYYLVAEDKRVAEWSLLRTARLCGADLWLRALVGEYDTVLGANDLAMEVYLDSG
jgi:hypothetical protein